MADPATVADRYEQLRSAVLRGAGVGWRHAWGVLVRSGMAAWAAVVARIPTTAGGRLAPDPAGAPAPPSGAVTAELVHVIAAMVLARPVPP